MNNEVEKQYKTILKDILAEGVERNDRTGIGCYSAFSKKISFDLDFFPILTGKKIFTKVFNTEFNWFISGETNIKRFKDNDIKIWDDWADSQGDLGPVYGHQLRNFNSQGQDQLANVIESIKNTPDSRRHVISLWNPCQLEEMALPPCYLYFQFFVENGKLNMFVVQRSADWFIGVPYDLALFSMLNIYVSKETGLKPNIVDVNFVDAHVYKNQLKEVSEYLKRDMYDLPSWEWENNSIILKNYKCGKFIKTKIAV